MKSPITHTLIFRPYEEWVMPDNGMREWLKNIALEKSTLFYTY